MLSNQEVVHPSIRQLNRQRPTPNVRLRSTESVPACPVQRMWRTPHSASMSLRGLLDVGCRTLTF
jgi:hypothetical protein